MNKPLFNIILSLLVISGIHAQNKRAIMAFEDQRFHDAIAILDKAQESGKMDETDLFFYTMSNYYIGNYSAAELSVKTLLNNHPQNDDYRYCLIKTYLAKKDFVQADSVWDHLSELNKEEPNFVNLKSSISSQAKWNKIVPKIEVKNFEEINTAVSDYSPYMHGQDMIFCTIDKSALENINELDAAQKSYSKLYKKRLGENDNRVAREFFPGLIHGKHIGPITISSDENSIYYTTASKEIAGINYLKIYSIEKTEETWGKPIKFAHNSIKYNVAHPALSDDNQTLYFASDMAGGYGGMDIYYSFMTPKGWSAPINLGEHVNTAENEVFPYFKDGYLYFSSNGHVGYGNLDLFKVEESQHWDFIENLRQPINSPYDDFGIHFTNEQEGYFSSDRPGGVGKDDIYNFYLKDSEPQVESQYITGIFEQKDTVLANVKVMLYDDMGNLLQEAFTNNKGEFFFAKERGITDYEIRISDEIEEFQDLQLLMTDQKGNVTEVLEADESGSFSFEILALDDFDNLVLMDQSDESFLTIQILGQVFNQELGDLEEEVDVYVVNQYGIVVDKTKTDSEGVFLFEQLKPDDQYVFSLGDKNDRLKVAIFDEYGNTVQIIIADENMRYFFERLSADDEYISLISETDGEIYIKQNESFEIPNIYYDLNSAELKPYAKQELDKLLVLLYNNPHVEIEITSHTDSRASNKYNMKLSQKRADKVASYLISKGVSSKRIDAFGMGESHLVNLCVDGFTCTEEEHAENRRTEFKIRKSEHF